MKIFTRCPTNSYHVVWSQILQTCPTKRYPINFFFSLLSGKHNWSLDFAWFANWYEQWFSWLSGTKKEISMNFRNKKVFGALNTLRFKNESLEESGSGVLNLWSLEDKCNPCNTKKRIGHWLWVGVSDTIFTCGRVVVSIHHYPSKQWFC